MAPPGGLPWNCSAETTYTRPIQIGASANLLNTALDLGDAGHTDVKMESLSLSAGFPLNENLTARLAVGPVIGGSLLTEPGVRFGFDSGFLLGASLEKQKPLSSGFFEQLDYSISLSAVKATTKADLSGSEADYTALDLRLGTRAIKRVSENGVGFLAARVFGGPVNWEFQGSDVTGSDEHHYQVALGGAVQVGKAGLFGEWAALGEKGFTAGVSTLW